MESKNKSMLIDVSNGRVKEIKLFDKDPKLMINVAEEVFDVKLEGADLLKSLSTDYRTSVRCYSLEKCSKNKHAEVISPDVEGFDP